MHFPVDLFSGPPCESTNPGPAGCRIIENQCFGRQSAMHNALKSFDRCHIQHGCDSRVNLPTCYNMLKISKTGRHGIESSYLQFLESTIGLKKSFAPRVIFNVDILDCWREYQVTYVSIFEFSAEFFYRI